MEVLFWAFAVVFFVIVEIITIQLVSVWLAVGAFVAMLSAYFIDGISIVGELIVFAFVSAILVGITLPYVQKQRKRSYIPTNSELEKGKQAIVIEEINSDKGTGRVTLNGVDWKAVSDSVIPVDTVVTVSSVKGAKLTVETMEVKL